MELKKSHGKILIFTGAIHSLFGITPWAFGGIYSKFINTLFFNINAGLSDFPLLGGTIDSANFAAFWFVYFGLLLISLGYLLESFIRKSGYVPRKFAKVYLTVVLIGAFMIPFSGMTIIMLPHAILMYRDSQKNK